MHVDTIKKFFFEAETLDEGFFKKLAEAFEVKEVAPSVQEYIIEYKDAEKIDGPFSLWGAKAVMNRITTYQDYVKFGGDRILPLLHLGDNDYDEQLYFRIDTGEVISSHYDSFMEENWVYFENAGDNHEKFLDTFCRDYCILKITDVINIQKRFSDIPDYNSLADAYSIEEMREIVAGILGMTDDELDKITGKFGMSFLYELLEED